MGGCWLERAGANDETQPARAFTLNPHCEAATFEGSLNAATTLIVPWKPTAPPLTTASITYHLYDTQCFPMVCSKENRNTHT